MYFTRSLFLILTALLSLGIGARSRAQQVGDHTTTEQEIAALISKLDADDYASREFASRSLLEIGQAAEPYLRAAMKHASAEIRQRAERLLLVLHTSKFHEQVQAFAADVDGQRNISLPSWSAFSEIVGTSRNCRTLFVQMQVAEPDLLRAYQNSPTEAAELLNVRLGVINAGRANNLSLGSIAVYLFVAGTAESERSDFLQFCITGMLKSPVFSKAYENPRYETPLRQLAGRWVKNAVVCSSITEAQFYVFVQLLAVICKLDLEEGAQFASGILEQCRAAEAKKPKQLLNSWIHGLALLAIGRLGDKTHLDAVAPSLNDTQRLMNPSTRALSQVQLRDLALAASVRLSGQKLDDYGIDAKLFKIVPDFNLFGKLVKDPLFADPQQRERALTQWQAWSKTNASPEPSKPSK